MLHRRIHARHGGLVLLVLTAFLPPLRADAQIERTHRDEWQKVDEIFAALGLEEGHHIADIGAGGGFLSVRLSVRVGPEGRVYAVDIDADVLEELQETARSESLDNIETILGETDDPRLPERSLDAALIVNAYHEMREYEGMLAGVRRALLPGGRLVIVDNPPRDSTRSRLSQIGQHDIAIGLVERDLEGAGFQVVERVPSFIDWDHGRHHHQEWMLVAVLPDTAGAVIR
jgi:ubiquinone/menaquinone biosynthesis C-methylase UbiE